MKQIAQFAVITLMIFAPQVAEAEGDTIVKPLARQDLGIPGKEAVMLKVDYPPGGSDPVHRHNATVFVYVLSGSVVMQVEGGEEVTIGPGETFTESPDDLHVVGRNASDDEPASFLAFFVKDTEAPAVIPVE